MLWSSKASPNGIIDSEDLKSLSPHINKNKLKSKDTSHKISIQFTSCDSSTELLDLTDLNDEQEIDNNRKTSLNHVVCRKVRFGSIATHKIENLTLKEKIKHQVWYSKEELVIIDNNNNDFLHLVEQKGIRYAESKQNETVRGLEHLLHDGKLNKKKKYFQDKCKKAVFREQLCQKRFGVSDSYRIKALYRNNGASKIQEVATKMGLYDEKVAIELLYQPAEERQQDEKIQQPKPTKHRNKQKNKYKSKKKVKQKKTNKPLIISGWCKKTLL